MLYRLPEWCTYLWLGAQPALGVHDGMGAYVHLEHDVNTGRPERRLLFDLDGSWHGLIGLPVYLDRPSLSQALADMLADSQLGGAGVVGADVRGAEAPPPTVLAIFRRAARAALPYVLYIASENADVQDPDRPEARPARARPTSIKGRRRWLPADRVRMWEVGFRVGRRLRVAEVGAGGAGLDDTHDGPRPHVRRAHWHTHLVGAGRSERRLRWLHPILVAAGGDPGLLVPQVHEPPLG